MSIGCSQYIPAFTYGVYFEDLSQLQKIDWQEQHYMSYTDKNGVLMTSNSSILNSPILNSSISRSSTTGNIVSFNNYPHKFTLKDVLLCKKQLFLNKGYDECLIYEFNLRNFINLETSSNYDAGINDITLRKNSILDLQPLTLKYKTAKVITHSLFPMSVYYSFDNKNFKKNDNIKFSHAPLYLKFKNEENATNILYDYMLLLKE